MSLTPKEKMDNDIWLHGRKKAYCTEAIKALKKIGLSDHPTIISAIKVIEKEKERLKNQCAFD